MHHCARLCNTEKTRRNIIDDTRHTATRAAEPFVHNPHTHRTHAHTHTWAISQTLPLPFESGTTPPVLPPERCREKTIWWAASTSALVSARIWYRPADAATPHIQLLHLNAKCLRLPSPPICPNLTTAVRVCLHHDFRVTFSSSDCQRVADHNNTTNARTRRENSTRTHTRTAHTPWHSHARTQARVGVSLAQHAPCSTVGSLPRLVSPSRMAQR